MKTHMSYEDYLICESAINDGTSIKQLWSEFKQYDGQWGRCDSSFFERVWMTFFTYFSVQVTKTQMKKFKNENPELFL